MLHIETLNEFLSYLNSERGFSGHTIEAYRRDVTHFFEFMKKNQLDLNTLSAQVFVNFLGSLKTQGYATNSIARTLMGLKTFFRFLYREKYIKENIALFFEAPKLWQGIPEILTEEEVEKLLQAPDIKTFEGSRDRAILEVLYASGLRVSELCSLDIYDVDDTFLKVKGKGNKERVVPLGKSALFAIDEFLSKFRSQFNSDEVKALFVNSRGKRIDRVEVWKLLKTYTQRVGLTKSVSPHSLRHTFATHLLDHGAPLRVIQEMLGHSSINSTNRYTQVSNKQLANDFRKFHPHWE